MRPSSIVALALLLPLVAASALGAPADDPRPIVPASEILAKIERGEPVEYDGVIIVGDLDLSGLDLPVIYVERMEYEIYVYRLHKEAKIVKSPIIIKNSEIRGYVNFGNIVFQRSSDFTGSNFSGYFDFRGAQFSGGHAEFSEAQFSSDANFQGAQFSYNAEFFKAQFSGDANFQGAQFSSYASFPAQFRGDANFREARFNDNALFVGAQFNSSADFGLAQFGGDAYFTRAQFGGDVCFVATQFSGNANFWGAQFSGDADFWEAQFSRKVELYNSRFDHANLRLADAENIYIMRLSNTTFENGSTICLNGTDYQRLYVHWDSIDDALIYNGEAYLALVKNFKAIEYFEDADDCYYQYRRERQSMRSWLEVAKYTDILGWVTCGYGVQPGYTLLLGLFVVLVSAVYYWRRDAIRRLKGDEDESAKFSDAFYFSMMTFTTVGYGDWYPLDRHRNVVMIEGIVGWLMLSLFLVTLANVIIR